MALSAQRTYLLDVSTQQLVASSRRQLLTVIAWFETRDWESS
jgi:hypothetical protein